jgi:hypothetical protein
VPPLIDLTNQTFGVVLVLRRHARPAGDRGPVRWWVRCGCGREYPARADVLRQGKGDQCRSCHGRGHADRQLAAGHTDRLHRPVWPRTCPICGAEFRGTARQVYCRLKCRPSYGRRKP